MSLTFQWTRNGATISGATSPTYLTTPTDRGAALAVRVTGARSGYATVTRTSAPTPSIAYGILVHAAPTVSGTMRVGQRLTAVAGTWGPAPVSLSYQWYRQGAAIAGAVDSTYTTTAADRGFYLTVRVTGAKPGYTTAVRGSSATPPIGYGLLTSVQPRIVGTTRVGQRLTATAGTWGPGSVTLRYQWYRSGVAISGAVYTTYTASPTDLGRSLSMRVTGTKSGFTTVVRSSVGTAGIGYGILTAPTPRVTGTPRVGARLTAAPGTWGPGSVSLRYQWRRNGVAVTGATASTYVVATRDWNAAMSVAVTGVKSGYTTLTRASAGTARVTAPVNVRFSSIYFDSPGNDNTTNYLEYVALRNLGATPAILNGYSVSDRVGHTFVFGSYTIAVGQTVRIYSGSGSNSQTARYWGQGGAVWNNDGDTAYFRTPSGTLLDTCSYSGSGTTATC